MADKGPQRPNYTPPSLRLPWQSVVLIHQFQQAWVLKHREAFISSIWDVFFLMLCALKELPIAFFADHGGGNGNREI